MSSRWSQLFVLNTMNDNTNSIYAHYGTVINYYSNNKSSMYLQAGTKYNSTLSAHIIT